jgi:hypothetical protein
VIAIRPASPSNSLAIALKSSASPGVFKSANTATLTVPRHVLAVRGSADLARSIVAGEYRHTSDIVKFDVVSSLAFASSRVRLHLRRPRAALAAVAATPTLHAQGATRHRARASRAVARRRFPPPLVMARRALDYVTLETRDVAVSVRVAAPTPY